MEKNIQITIPGYGDNVVRRKLLIVPFWLYERATQARKKITYDTQYIIDANIKGCFDNLAHVWLIDNVPMPLGYEILLKKYWKQTYTKKYLKGLVSTISTIKNNINL